MRLAFLILLTVLGHIGFVGSRVTVSLHAIQLQASALTVGVLMSLYALLPMLISVATGRMLDRVGALRPLVYSSAVLAAGIALPFAWPGLAALYVAAIVIGTAFTVQHIAFNHAVGAIGGASERAVNFSWFALGFAVSGFVGPLSAGFSIDGLGHRAAYAVLAAFPALGLVLLLARRSAVPEAHGRKPASQSRGVADLLREPRLRAAFLFSALLGMGWDLYAFVLPLYGSAIGLSASTIGIVMGSFAAATFAVRLAMPMFVRRLREWTVVTAAFFISGCAYSAFPFVAQVPLLMALSFALGLGLGCSQPTIMAILYGASPPGREGEVVGVRTTLMNASHTFLPLGFGALGAALGSLGPVFGAMAGMLLVGGWFARRRGGPRG